MPFMPFHVAFLTTFFIFSFSSLVKEIDLHV
jgi:hypothetical protein